MLASCGGETCPAVASRLCIMAMCKFHQLVLFSCLFFFSNPFSARLALSDRWHAHTCKLSGEAKVVSASVTVGGVRYIANAVYTYISSCSASGKK
jgi:hypothetical protein